LAARLVLSLPSCVSISAAMHNTLHWLDFQERITYKLALLVYKCLHGLAPEYLSASANLLSVTRCDISFGAQAFCSAAVAIWNSLPPPNVCYYESHNIPQKPEISSFPFSLCHCLVTHLSASNLFTTMALYKFTYLGLLTYLTRAVHFIWSTTPPFL